MKQKGKSELGMMDLCYIHCFTFSSFELISIYEKQMDITYGSPSSPGVALR